MADVTVENEKWNDFQSMKTRLNEEEEENFPSYTVSHQ